jgi:hypothetical protein
MTPDPPTPDDDQGPGPPGPSFWSFVPLEDYRVPTLPARGALANAWGRLRRALRRAEDPGLPPARDETQLRRLPESRLAHLVAPLDPADPAEALDAALYDWLQDAEPRSAVRFVVGQPHGCLRDMLPCWAARRGATLIEPPTPREILEGDRDVPSRFAALGRPERLWVIPDLARWYLRHSEGLTLVRRLLARAETGELGRGVIGCGSWAWAYLSRIWPLPHPDALTAQAFDAARLTRLLARQVRRHPHRRLRFRHAATGRDLLVVPAADEEPPAPEITRLAAHCRGNPGTALAYWRESLRTEPDTEEVAATSEPDHSGDFFEEEAVWVSARIHEPLLPVETDEDILLVLHALLLHDGLPGELLPELLPIARDDGQAILLRLIRIGLIARQDDRWQVTARGYAGVRSLLRGRDYLIDAF